MYDETTTVIEPPSRAMSKFEERQMDQRVRDARRLIEKFEDSIVFNPRLSAVYLRVERSEHADKLIEAAPFVMDVIADHLLGLEARKEERKDYGNYNSAKDMQEAWFRVLLRVGHAFFHGSHPGKNDDFTQMGKWAKENAL